MVQQSYLHPSSARQMPTGDESLESLVRSIKVNEETIKVGTELCRTMEKQGGQIDHVIDEFVGIDKNTQVADRIVGRISSTFGFGIRHRIRRWWSKKPSVEDVVESERREPKARRRFLRRSPRVKAEVKVAVDPIDSALGIINGQLGQIKELATQFGSELDRQNARLGVAQSAAEVAVNNVEDVTLDAESAT